MICSIIAKLSLTIWLTRCWSEIIHLSTICLLSILEGRQSTLADQTVKLVYEQMSVAALSVRIEHWASAVPYFDRVRSTKRLHDKIKGRKNSILNLLGMSSAAASTQPTPYSFKAEPYRGSYSSYLESHLAAASLNVLPPSETVEPPWQHKYATSRHEHTLIYLGAMLLALCEVCVIIAVIASAKSTKQAGTPFRRVIGRWHSFLHGAA